ncbi:MAG TPA: lasso peptide biosynthesis B2 protein [Coleofasciculaceae cyanobacterium]
MSKLHKLLKLTGRDYCLLINAFCLLGAIRLGLRVLPFRILLRMIGKLGHPVGRKSSAAAIAANKVAISKIVWAVEISTRYMPGGAKCLARALTTKVLLDRQGDTPDLRIGVTKGANGALEAHAWIEHQGRVVIGNLRDLSQYIPLPSIEGVKL